MSATVDQSVQFVDIPAHCGEMNRVVPEATNLINVIKGNPQEFGLILLLVSAEYVGSSETLPGIVRHGTPCQCERSEPALTASEASGLYRRA